MTSRPSYFEKLKGGEVSAEVQYDENGKPVVYRRRWYVLGSLTLGYFFWNWHSFRQVILAPEYARYHNVTTEVSFPSFGIDAMVVFDNFLLLFFYPLGGYLTDRFGLRMQILGCTLQALSCWWWYFSFTNYWSVIASRVVANLGGVMISTGILAVSNRWFPEEERAIATAFGAIVAVLGGGAALIVGGLFQSGEELIDLGLRSCKASLTTRQIVIDAAINGTDPLCTDEAFEEFCCYTETAIEVYNLILAILTSLIAVYAVLSVRDLPPSPPSPAALEKPSLGPIQASVRLFTQQNYLLLCISDFLISGPPLMLYSAIARILPGSVAQYDFIASAAGLVLAIPFAYVVTRFLDLKKWYYSTTLGGYSSGTLFWTLATICYAIGTLAAEYIILFLVAAAVLTFVLWQVGVYELKIEYVFTPDYNLEGWVVGYDRVIINLSSLVFVSAIVPERTGSGLTSMWIGLIFMCLGLIPVLSIRNKFEYRRYEHEGGGQDPKRVSAAIMQELARPPNI